MIEFTEQHELFRLSLKEFLDKEVKPFVDEWEKEGKIPRSVFKKMGCQGFLATGFEEKYGGQALDFTYDVIFLEELSKTGSGGFAASASCTQYLPGSYLSKFASEELKKKYLPKIAAGEWVGSLAITEPQAGSDVQNIQCKAEENGDHYLLNGRKTFITNAVYGDFCVFVVRTSQEQGLQGISTNKLDKLGWRASDTAEIFLSDVKVPKKNLLGEEGQGFYYLMQNLQLERLTLAIGGYASAQGALDLAKKYMSEREAFGRKINKFQVLRHKIAQMASEIECNKQFVYYCVERHVRGDYIVKECSMAKLLATELSDKICSEALQFFGGYGFIEDFKIARYYRDTRIGSIGGGTSEIMREIIAKIEIDGALF